jgi:multicomponent Na+:H+ antiporter subunit A
MASSGSHGAERSRPHPLTLVPLTLAGATAWLLLTFEEPWRMSVPWVPSLGIDVTLWFDGLSLQMLTLIAGVGVAVFIYASAYMAGVKGRGRLFSWLTAFMLAMAGAVTADNLVVLFVFWEMTSITSFLLVGFKYQEEANRKAAQQALLVTGGGGLILLGGIVLLGIVAGTYSIQEIIAGAHESSGHPLLPAALACIFIGAFSKSAQWPFHFWLPNAMAAPTPVSAYLHSATMVKLGIYLLARLKPAFGFLLFWEVTLVTIGATTALWAMVLTLRERDLKRILAWSTVSALGTLVMLIGLPGAGAAEATAAFLVAHALYKAPLFFVAGNVDHTAGTRDINRLAGLARVMPWTAGSAALAGLSMAGVPLSLGYVAKDLLTIAKTEGLAFEWVGHTTVVVSVVSVAVAAVAAVRVFWHRGGASLPEDMHEAPMGMRVPPLALAALGAVLGLAPWLMLPALHDSARAMMPPTTRDLVGMAGVASAATVGPFQILALGLVLFFAWDRLHVWMDFLRWFDRFGLSAVYTRGLTAIPATARLVTTRLQHGSLPGYLAVVLALPVVAITIVLLSRPAGPWPAWSAPPLGAAGAAAIVIGASVAACRLRDPFVMLLVTGLAGIGAGIFALYLGAPDVALTQFTVEVAFVVVVAAVLLRVRNRTPAPLERMGGRPVLAIGLGAVTTVLVLAAAALPFDPSLPRYFGDQAVPAAFGRNVVNVIIVDFRALDTLGEIAVVTITFIGALPLLRWLRARRKGTA